LYTDLASTLPTQLGWGIVFCADWAWLVVLEH
jgi:hypothetical protein